MGFGGGGAPAPWGAPSPWNQQQQQRPQGGQGGGWGSPWGGNQGGGGGGGGNMQGGQGNPWGGGQGQNRGNNFGGGGGGWPTATTSWRRWRLRQSRLPRKSELGWIPLIKFLTTMVFQIECFDDHLYYILSLLLPYTPLR